MDKTIFLVMYAYYNDWEIYGYFITRDEADRSYDQPIKYKILLEGYWKNKKF